MTARGVAGRYAVSYQTAHRLLADLERCGLIERRARSGTYISGAIPKPTFVQLVLHPRAGNPQGFGGKLQRYVLEAFRAAGIACTQSLDPDASIQPGALPVLWESPNAVERCVSAGHAGILLNERPRPGWRSSLLDSVCTDDFAGGALAADTLLHAMDPHRCVAVLAGPVDDRRSDERVAGFLSRIKDAHVIHASSWHRDAGRRCAPQLIDRGITGLFAANDRLAQGVLLAYQSAGQAPPALVGYDDAPIAERLGLTTIALPWQAMASAVVQRARLRLAGDLSPACTMLLQPSVLFHEPQ